MKSKSTSQKGLLIYEFKKKKCIHQYVRKTDKNRQDECKTNSVVQA